MKKLNEIKKEATNNNNNNNNNNNKEDMIMERREEIKTELKEIMEQIKEEEKELEYFGGDIYFQNYNTNTLEKASEDINELINDYVDNKFIYYSEANKFLEDYVYIYEYIKEYKNEFGTIPENECQLAAYILKNEIYNYDYNTLEEIYDYIDKIEELQEELEELEAEASKLLIYELNEDYEER
jgi:DNA repair exonuclease SbcCD ATPase subunit